MPRGLNLDAEFVQGKIFEVPIWIYSVPPGVSLPSGTPTPGTLQDITGWTFSAKFRTGSTTGQPQITLTDADFIRNVAVSGEALNCSVLLRVPTARTKAPTGPGLPGLTGDPGVYDAEAVRADNEALELLYGKFTTALEASY